MSVDPTTRFTQTVGDYARYRPDYPDALVRWAARLCEWRPSDTIVDLGAGTGLSTRRFARHGFEMIGVEPNAAMRAGAEGAPRVRFVDGAATATGLATACAAGAIACQAFHWFDVAATCRELTRVVRPGGWAVAIWNLRTRHPAMRAYDALLTAYSTDFAQVPTGQDSIAALRGAVAGSVRATFANVQRLDRAGLRGRAGSSSYVRRGVADLEGFYAALDAVFDAHAVDGHIAFTYDCCAIAWPLR